MITLYERSTGKALERENVDAREILRNSPELYTAEKDQVPEHEALVDITVPSNAPRLSDSGFPAGKEFTRRITEDDQRLLIAAQHEGRSLPPDGERVAADIKGVREAKRAEALAAAESSEPGRPLGRPLADMPSAGLTASEIRDALDRKGVKHSANASKAELAALLDGAR